MGCTEMTINRNKKKKVFPRTATNKTVSFDVLPLCCYEVTGSGDSLMRWVPVKGIKQMIKVHES